ncbi:MAG TPA: serine hydrolase domain-containing protein, partial [Pilimelia sp.]|nr:serine hydrolase domain-containing protein [Pilimelia sp.]
YFPPGAGFHYSDTGYVLAGLIVRQVTGEPLHRLIRRLVLSPLRLRDTYTESLERPNPRTPPRAHQYFQTVDTYDFDPSFDLYGGGGLVSTVGDLARFLRGLLAGRLFRHRATLRLMIRPNLPASYGMGLQWFDLDGARAVGHTGFFGAFAGYVPARRLLVTSTTNQSEGSSHAPAQGLARVLRDNPID